MGRLQVVTAVTGLLAGAALVACRDKSNKSKSAPEPESCDHFIKQRFADADDVQAASAFNCGDDYLYQDIVPKIPPSMLPLANPGINEAAHINLSTAYISNQYGLYELNEISKIYNNTIEMNPDPIVKAYAHLALAEVFLSQALLGDALIHFRQSLEYTKEQKLEELASGLSRIIEILGSFTYLKTEHSSDKKIINKIYIDSQGRHLNFLYLADDPTSYELLPGKIKMRGSSLYIECTNRLKIKFSKFVDNFESIGTANETTLEVMNLIPSEFFNRVGRINFKNMNSKKVCGWGGDGLVTIDYKCVNGDLLVHEIFHNWEEYAGIYERISLASPRVEKNYCSEYGMKEWNEDLAECGAHFVYSGEAYRNNVTEQLEKGQYHLALKYLAIRYASPFKGAEYDKCHMFGDIAVSENSLLDFEDVKKGLKSWIQNGSEKQKKQIQRFVLPTLFRIEKKYWRNLGRDRKNIEVERWVKLMGDIEEVGDLRIKLSNSTREYISKQMHITRSPVKVNSSQPNYERAKELYEKTAAEMNKRLALGIIPTERIQRIGQEDLILLGKSNIFMADLYSYKEQNYDQALTYYRRAENVALKYKSIFLPHSAIDEIEKRIHLGRGRILCKKGAYKNALNQYALIKTLGKEDPTKKFLAVMFLDLGNQLRKREDYENAIKAYDKGIKIAEDKDLADHINCELAIAKDETPNTSIE